MQQMSQNQLKEADEEGDEEDQPRNHVTICEWIAQHMEQQQQLYLQ